MGTNFGACNQCCSNKDDQTDIVDETLDNNYPANGGYMRQEQ